MYIETDTSAFYQNTIRERVRAPIKKPATLACARAIKFFLAAWKFNQRTCTQVRYLYNARAQVTL